MVYCNTYNTGHSPTTPPFVFCTLFMQYLTTPVKVNKCSLPSPEEIFFKNKLTDEKGKNE